MQKATGLCLFVIVASFQFSPVIANDHRLFDQVLQAHVSDGFVDYGGIQADERFRMYLDYLENADPDSLATRDEKLAFWINAYNALAIKGVLDGLSTGSFLSRLRFFSTDHRLAGRQIDLDDLEHEIIIPFAEPRVHFAIVCASSSCPKLRSEAYVADRLEQQLELNTRAFINNQTKNRIDKTHRTARISKIFDWYADDFEAHSTTVQQYLGQYVDDPEIAQGLRNDEYQVWYLDYDWSLNGSKPGHAGASAKTGGDRSDAS
jgi:hypothetical protein